MTDATLPAENDAPHQARLRAWARRHLFAASVSALVALVLLLRLGWGWYYARRLAAGLDAVRRRGEPVTVGIFAENPVPPTENAWTHYAAAADVVAMAFVNNSPRQSSLQYPPYAPRGPEWEKRAAASEQGNAAAFPLARLARPLQRLQFPQIPLAGANPFRREWGQARALANTLADGAEYAHVRRDDAEAVERLLDGLHLGRLGRQDPGIGSQLEAIGTTAQALDVAQQVIPTLALAGTGETGRGNTEGGNPASPAQARALLDALLDESHAREGFVLALRRQRALLLTELDQASAQTWLIRPMADRTAAHVLRDFDLLIRSAERDNGRQARETLRPLLAPQQSNALTTFGFSGREKSVPRYSRWFEGFVASGAGVPAASLEVFHQESAERRMTAVMLAARLYRHDHGRWPDDAAALVPAYLKAIPADPFRADGGPLGYVVLRGALPGGGDRPLVYSDAGEAGGNSENAIDTEPMYGWQNALKGVWGPHGPWREMRQYRDVSLWRPTKTRFEQAREDAQRLAASTRPSNSAAETVENDPDKPDAPRDHPEHDEAPRRPADQ